MPDVTVIIPTYNGEKYIERCIKSFNLTKKDGVEILVIDDLSKDNTVNLVKELSRENNNIRLIINNKNIGVARTRNLGIKKARGKYIIFADQDDYVEDGFINKYKSLIDSEKYDAVFGGYKRIKDKVLIREQIPRNSKYGKLLITAPWAKIFRKDFLIKNNIEFFNNKFGEDIIPIIKTVAVSNKIHVFNDSSYIWWFNSESVSNTSQKALSSQDIKSILKLLNEIKKIDINESIKKYFLLRTGIFYILRANYKSSESVNIIDWLKNNDCLKFAAVSHPPRDELFKVKILSLIVYIAFKTGLLRIYLTY